MTKIFCDIADIKIVKKFNKKKLVKGFTTNPSLMRKAGANDYRLYSKRILKITKVHRVSDNNFYGYPAHIYTFPNKSIFLPCQSAHRELPSLQPTYIQSHPGANWILSHHRAQLQSSGHCYNHPKQCEVHMSYSQPGYCCGHHDVHHTGCTIHAGRSSDCILADT